MVDLFGSAKTITNWEMAQTGAMKYLPVAIALLALFIIFAFILSRRPKEQPETK